MIFKCCFKKLLTPTSADGQSLEDTDSLLFKKNKLNEDYIQGIKRRYKNLSSANKEKLVKMKLMVNYRATSTQTVSENKHVLEWIIILTHLVKTKSNLKNFNITGAAISLAMGKDDVYEFTKEVYREGNKSGFNYYQEICKGLTYLKTEDQTILSSLFKTEVFEYKLENEAKTLAKIKFILEKLGINGYDFSTLTSKDLTN